MNTHSDENGIPDGFPKRLDSHIIYESDWLTLYADRVKLPNGEILPVWHRIHMPHASVAAVLFDHEGRILLIRSKRYSTGRLEWEIPAGRVETGETPEEAVRRECMEETGFTLRSLTFLASQNPDNGLSDLTIHLFAAKVQEKTRGFDANEVEDMRWVTRKKALSMLRRNEISCGTTMLALLYAIQFDPF